MSSWRFLHVLLQQKFKQTQKCQQDVKNLFPSLLASNTAFQEGREGADLVFSRITPHMTWALYPLWSKGCAGGHRRRWCFGFVLLLQRSTLVFSESFRDYEIGLIRICQDAARSVAVIREMQKVLEKLGSKRQVGVCYLQKILFAAFPGDQALSQTCSKVSSAGSRPAKSGWLLLSQQEYIQLLIL